MPQEQQDRRSTDSTIRLIAQKVDKVESSVDKLTEAITKLAIIDERQIADRHTIERLFSAIEKTEARWVTLFEKVTGQYSRLEEKVSALETKMPEMSQTVDWVKAALWAAAGLAVLIIITKIGLLK